MKNWFSVAAVTVLMIVSLGCGGAIDGITGGSSDNSANKSLEDRAVDATVGESKIGIKECDDTIDLLNEQINNPDDNFIVKAAKRTMLNQFRDQLKRSLEENQANKGEVAKFCAEFKKNIVDSATESNSASNKK